MKTLVFQSFRQTDVPGWINRCIDSVMLWSRLQGFDYLLVGDEFFDVVPKGLNVDGKENLYPRVDLARLAYIRKLHQEKDYDRIVWLDADVLIFDPENFHIPAYSAFCHEQMLWVVNNKPQLPAAGVNNAVIVSVKGDSLVDDVYQRCCNIITQKLLSQRTRCMLGPEMLVDMAKEVGIPLIHGIGSFSDYYRDFLLIWMTVGGDKPRELRDYRAAVDHQIVGGNLGHFRRNELPEHRRAEFDKVMDRFVSVLLTTRGRVVN